MLTKTITSIAVGLAAVGSTQLIGPEPGWDLAGEGTESACTVHVSASDQHSVCPRPGDVVCFDGDLSADRWWLRNLGRTPIRLPGSQWLRR